MIYIKRYQKFLSLWALDSALLYFSVMFMPTNYSLGNNLFTMLQAALFTGFLWNVVLWYTGPVLKDLDLESKNPTTMMLSYLTVNFFTLWVLARMAFTTGFGVSSFTYVLVLAFVGNLLQYAVWQATEKRK